MITLTRADGTRIEVLIDEIERVEQFGFKRFVYIKIDVEEDYRSLIKISARRTIDEVGRDGGSVGGLGIRAQSSNQNDGGTGGSSWPYGVEGLPDGRPCSHPGCLSHISHPCEGCGRIAGRKADV